MKNKKFRDWQIMVDFLTKRNNDPWRNPAYVFYFLIVIVLVGTFGVFKELMETNWCSNCVLDSQKVKSFCFNVSSTGLSLVTASVIELIFISRRSVKNESTEQKYDSQELESIKISIRIFGLCSLILTFVSWIIINSIIENDILKIFFSVFVLLFSYFIWWISNVRNKILKNGKTNLQGIIGGGTVNSAFADGSTNVDYPATENSESSSLSGDISEFKK